MDTREHLQQTALRLFSMRGYDGVGVQEIVESAGVTKPSLYHHFGSKRGLLEALLKERGGLFIAAIDTASAYDGDLSHTLERVLDAAVDFAEGAPDFYRFWLSLLFCPPQHEAFSLAEDLFTRQRAPLEEMFRRAAEDHGNMKGRQARYAYVFIGLINAVVAARINGEERLDAAQRRDILHQFSHGIYS